MGDVEIVNIDNIQRVRGRVEFKYNNEWGTACKDGATNQVAKFFCKSVNLPYANAKTLIPYKAGTGKIWLINIRCSGDESQILNCRRNPTLDIGTACAHTEDLGVECY